jgi:TP901 family phage tail tape measure protein
MARGERKARIELTGNADGLRRATAEGRRDLRAFGRDAEREAKRADRQRARQHRRRAIGGAAAGAIGFGFGFAAAGISNAVDDARAYEVQMARLAVAQGKSSEQMAGFREAVQRSSKETGIARSDLLAGVQAYQALTGDTEGGTRAMATFARVAQATGSSMSDVAGTAAALSQNLKIDPADFEAAFDVLNVQGKAGAIELKDLAAQMASLTPQFSKFAGGTGIAGMQKMGAAAQIIRRNFGGTAEAATGMRALMTQVVKNASKLEKAGVKVFWKDAQGKKHLKEFDAIVEDIGKSKLMADPVKLTKALGSAEALRALQALTDNFGEFQSMVAETGSGSIAKDLENFLESPAGKMEQAMNKMKTSFIDALPPERIEAMADAVSSVSGLVNKVAGGVDKAGDVVADVVEALAWPWRSKPEDPEGERTQKRMSQLWWQGMSDEEARAQIGKEDEAKRQIAKIASGERTGSAADVRALIDQVKSEPAVAWAMAQPAFQRASLRDEPFAGGDAVDEMHRRALFTGEKGALTALVAPRRAPDEYLRDLAANDPEAIGMTTPKTLAGLSSSASPEVMARTFAAAVANVLAAQLAKQQVVVKVDGNEIAKSSANATDRRRR